MIKIIVKVLGVITQALIEVIFPYFCVGCGKKNTLLCFSCYEKIEFCSFPFNNLKETKYIDDVIVACKYQGVTKKLIHEFKYKSVIDIGKIIGKLMNEHHAILRDDLKITVPKIDAMIDAALQAGAYGAKIVGSGGGGSIVVLSPSHKKEVIINAMLKSGAKAAYEVSVSQGVHCK